MSFRDRVQQIPIFFAIIALLGGLFFAVMIPLGQEHNGEANFLTAYDVSKGNILEPFVVLGHGYGFSNRPADYYNYEVGIIDPDTAGGKEYQARMKSIKLTGATALAPDARRFTSFTYYPQAMGLFIGRLCNMSVYGAVILAHILNLMVYIALTFFAIRLLPLGKLALTAIALSPLCLFQAASLSPMATVYGLVFFFMAYVMYLSLDAAGSLGVQHLLIPAIILTALYMYDFPYLILGLLILHIPRTFFDSRKNYWKSFAIAMSPLLTYMLFQAIFTGFFPMGKGVYNGPLLYIKILIPSIYHGFTLWYRTLNYVGWQNFSLQPLVYWLPLLWLAILVMETPGEDIELENKYRIVLGGTFAGLFLAQMLSAYFAHGVTYIGLAQVVSNMDSRNIIMFLPMLGMALKPRKLRYEGEYMEPVSLLILAGVLAWAIWIFGVRMYGTGFLTYV